jgi:hypothetical protein
MPSRRPSKSKTCLNESSLINLPRRVGPFSVPRFAILPVFYAQGSRKWRVLNLACSHESERAISQRSRTAYPRNENCSRDSRNYFQLAGERSIAQFAFSLQGAPACVTDIFASFVTVFICSRLAWCRAGEGSVQLTLDKDLTALGSDLAGARCFAAAARSSPARR